MPDTPLQPVTVSIVSHGQQGLLLPLLEQLHQHCAEHIDKVVLTVNIPEEDQVAGRAWGFRVQQIVNPRPKGFGANHNAAFLHCESDWFLVLNPDIRLDSDILEPLLALAQRNCGVLTPRIFEPGRTRPEPHRGLLTPCEILQRNMPWYRPPQEPAWIPGMFMLLRAEAFRALAGFNARFFMYGEDFDLCARLSLAGWAILVAQDLDVLHDARRASRNNLIHLRWHFLSLLKVWTSSAFWRYVPLWRKRMRAFPDRPV